MGGYSSEYQISLKSGSVVCQFLPKDKYEVFAIHILQEKWVFVDTDELEYPVDKSDFSVQINGKKIQFDVIFNAIHGHPGEDGVLMAYFELLGIPFTSDNSYTMALTFNKRDTLSVLAAYDVPKAQSVFLNIEDRVDTQKIIQKVGLPCFVKANKAGSSYGISKVYKEEELLPAIVQSFQEDDEILIEEFLDGREVSVGVINYRGEIRVLPITEIISENDFFDYEAKYLGKSQEVTPAELTAVEEQKVIAIAKKVYKSLRLKGFSRAEYIFKNGTPHFLEINMVPGLTAESLLPQQARAAGISLTDLFDNAIEIALQKESFKHDDFNL